MTYTASANALSIEDQIEVGVAITRAANRWIVAPPHRVLTDADHFGLARIGAAAIERTPENLPDAGWDYCCDVAAALLGWHVA